MEEITNQEIDNLGQYLKNIREEKKIPAAQVAQELKTSLSVIQAIENNEYEQLPAPIYVKGYLRSYAKFLGLDDEMILNIYKKNYPYEIKQELVIKPEEIPGININWGKILNPKIWTPILIALILAVASIILIVKIKKAKQPEPIATIPAETQEEIMPEPEPRPQITKPEKPASLTLPLDIPITITAQATDAVWMRVSGDNKLIFEGILAKKEEKTWPAAAEYKLRIGNPGKLNLTINNYPYGKVSPFGGPVNVVINKDGVKIEN